MDPGSFRRRRESRHDFVFFGHTPVRTHKVSGRWHCNEEEVREAARAVSALPWDPHDLVDARELGSLTRSAALEAPGWRGLIHGVLQAAGRNGITAEGGCPHGVYSCDALVPCGLSAASLERWAAYCIACVTPIPTVVIERETWLVPRVHALILDQWQAAEAALRSEAETCGTCGARSENRGSVPGTDWRVPVPDGWLVICPDCTDTAYRRYADELVGVAYRAVREHGPRADTFRCSTCSSPRPARDWDHCHDHGLVRGPLCGNCNTAEAHGKDFLSREGSVEHLLRCTGCRTRRVLPEHHRLAVLRRHLHADSAAQGCGWPLHMHVLLEKDGAGYHCTMRCRRTRVRARGSCTSPLRTSSESCSRPSTKCCSKSSSRSTRKRIGRWSA